MKHLLLNILLVLPFGIHAQQWYVTTENNPWKEKKIYLSSKPFSKPVMEISGKETGVEFKAWGTCFNELDADALEILSPEAREEIYHNLFSPDGDLKFTRGRLTMNANDYSRAWYSCSEVPGDFGLKYFNINHDKQNVIPMIKEAQMRNPEMSFWVSPWSPPTWMKINNDYPVVSSKYNNLSDKCDYNLFESADAIIDEDEMKLMGERNGVFPRRLAVNDYFIQDPRYLKAYADMFCKFIDLYKEEGIPIDMVMYQNEAYSYTPYPGCAWTVEGTQRFNRDYLSPALKEKHPDVKLFLGTFNTNRQDYIEKILSDEKLVENIEGIGVQWEAREVFDNIREKYPQLRFIQTESECGNGSFDWNAGKRTFFLLCDYIGKGCDEYFIWNFILPDNGESPWGWKQNALIHVNSKEKTFNYTPEYYAVKHFSNFVSPGSRMIGYESDKDSPVIAFRTNEGDIIVMAGNFSDSKLKKTIKIGSKYLNMVLEPQSFNTFSVEG